jgi:hypothetical protein
MLVVLPQDDLGCALAVDLEDAHAVRVVLVGEGRKVLGGLQTKTSNDCIADVGEPSDPRWLLGNEESPQNIWIAGGAQGQLNRKCVCEIHGVIGSGDGGLRRKSNRFYEREFAWHEWHSVSLAIMPWHGA